MTAESPHRDDAPRTGPGQDTAFSRRREGPLAHEGDASLLVYMALADEDGELAQQAWEELYCRHAEYLYAVCVRAYGPILGGQAGAGDVVAESFRRAYEHAGTYEPGDAAGADAQRRRVRAWLGRIAQRVALTALRNRGRLAAAQLEPEHWQQIAPPPPPKQANRETIARVRKALAGLTAREQTVLRATLQWYQPDKAHQRLPNDVAAELARTLRTTPENLRQIRRRALTKLRRQLADLAGADRADPPGGRRSLP